jgi:hypothetical protein
VSRTCGESVGGSVGLQFNQEMSARLSRSAGLELNVYPAPRQTYLPKALATRGGAGTRAFTFDSTRAPVKSVAMVDVAAAEGNKSSEMVQVPKAQVRTPRLRGSLYFLIIFC